MDRIVLPDPGGRGSIPVCHLPLSDLVQVTSPTRHAMPLLVSGPGFLLCERVVGAHSRFPHPPHQVIIPEGCRSHCVASTPRGSFSVWPTAAPLPLPRRHWPFPPTTTSWCTWASLTTSSTRPGSCTNSLES